MGGEAAKVRHPQHEKQSYEKMRLLRWKAGIRCPLP
jgi:hypothetical protein